MKTYYVTARRWERGWELHIEGAGVTQARTTSEAERMVRDYLRLDGVEEPFDVVIEYHPDADLDAEVQAARQAVKDAARAQEIAAAKAREAAHRMEARKYRRTEIAAVLGVSKQRASQLLNSKIKAKKTRPVNVEA